MDENQCRKKLKQVLYRYFAAQNEADSIHQHPWGIMTGIRPTKIVHRYRDTVMHEHEMQEQKIKKTIMDEYFLREDKADLLLEVTKRQRPFLLTPEEANDYVKIVSQKAQRLHRMTNDLFDISKVESGNMHMNFEQIDIADHLRQTLAELDEKIIESNLDFKNQLIVLKRQRPHKLL